MNTHLYILFDILQLDYKYASFHSDISAKALARYHSTYTLPYRARRRLHKFTIDTIQDLPSLSAQQRLFKQFLQRLLDNEDSP